MTPGINFSMNCDFNVSRLYFQKRIKKAFVSILFLNCAKIKFEKLKKNF
jgi:hypothetical protein